MIRWVVAAGLAALVTQATHARNGQDVSEGELESASAGRTVRIRQTNGGIVDLPVELYVARVLAGEGEPRAAAAAQQVLAIAVRTFAATNVGRHRRDGFDFCDTTHCQVLRPTTAASREAAKATVAQVLTYEGRPAEVFYSASCGGRTEAASQVWSGATNLPYLRSADDEVHGGEEPWVLEVPLARVEDVLRRAGFEGSRLKDVEVEGRTESGRVATLHVSGLRPEQVTGEDFRAVLGTRELRSTQFTVERARDVLRFVGRGYGHGVGLCVVGASRRAARGEGVAGILERYYPGLLVEVLGGGPEIGRSRRLDTGSSGRPRNESNSLPDLPELPVISPVSLMPPILAMAERARDELGARLGVAERPALQVRVHKSLEAFRRATGRPWWTGVAVDGTSLDLAPVVVLDERDGLEAAVRRGVAEVLLAPLLDGRPAWVRVGAARYYAASTGPAQRGAGPPKSKCPPDAELTMPVSAAAYRVAELRAEACFARALASVADWRLVR